MKAKEPCPANHTRDRGDERLMRGEGGNRTYRGALIGCGFFARNQMAAWLEMDRVSIEAVCDIDPENARRFASEFGIGRVFTDAGEMLASVRPDFVDIVTPTSSHHDLVEMAARAGVAAICQKPFAQTVDQAIRMVELCEQAGVPLLVHENFRWQRPFLHIRKMLKDRAIGDMFFMRLSFRHNFDVYQTQPHLRDRKPLFLFNMGPHLFDLARYLAGDIENVFARIQYVDPAVKGETAFTISAAHAGGAQSLLECSFASHIVPDPFPQTLAWIEGSEGTIELAPGYRIRTHKDGNIEEESANPAAPGWGNSKWAGVQESVQNIQRHWIDVLDGSCDAQPSGRFTIDTQRLCLASYESVESGMSINMKNWGMPNAHVARPQDS
ncbi:MAG: Gfo/Idh/MocA family oxidoreductase [Rhizobiaceae bacterium]|nr:Gfo/Idh/MocA family oxidoreductase [Rhizobiaceae bacterium]